MRKSFYKKLFWVTVFAISMGFLESAVVVYLRQLYYPSGFEFPLKLISGQIALTEFIRELATFFMLLSVGILAGKNFNEKFAWFIYSFAIWDIFYYVFLKLILSWPDSLFTWDVLFLVPVIWAGPVLAPVINSLMMIFLSMIILGFGIRNTSFRIPVLAWCLLILGSIIIFISYTNDYTRFLLSRFSFLEIINHPDKQLFIDYSMKFIPRTYSWFVFIAGATVHFVAILLIIRNNIQIKSYAG